MMPDIKYELHTVGFDEGPVCKAWLGPDRWNGFAIPLVDRENALKWLESQDKAKAEGWDVVTGKFEGDEIALDWGTESVPEEERYARIKPETILIPTANPDERQNIEVWDISLGMVWQEWDDWEKPKPVTVLDLAAHRLGRQPANGQDFCDVGLAIMGGCQKCGASIAAYNAYPTKTKYWRCEHCITDDIVWFDVGEANREMFQGLDQATKKQLAVCEHQQCPVHLVTPGGDWMYLDLGTPSQKPNDFSGPRIALRRLDDGSGWRIVLHADSGDPFLFIDIIDGAHDRDPVITMTDGAHNPVPLKT